MTSSPTANIVQLFHAAARRHPAHTAIIQGKQQVTYAELQQQVQATAAWLVQQGVCQGDRVLVFVPMGIPLYRMVLAIFHVGATAVFLDEWVSKSRMELCCQTAGCRAFVGVFKARLLVWFSTELRRIPIRMGARLPHGFLGTIPEPAAVHSDYPALITFTTGSTGTPKAAKRTHAFLQAQFEALTEKLAPRPEDIDVTVLPIVVLLNLGIGATSVIVPYKASKAAAMPTAKVWALLVKHRVNRLTASPFFVDQLARYALNCGQQLPAIRQVFTGGAPVFPDEAKRYIRAFPTAVIEVVYGSTEAEPISSVDARQLIASEEPSEGLLVGTVYGGADVRIIAITDAPIVCADEAAFAALEQPVGQIGEIVVAGRHVLTEYFNNETALRRNKIFVGGRCWHRTGDSGFRTTEGSLYLTGRCQQLIHQAGKTLSPFVWEYRLRALPGVACGTLLQQGGVLIAIVEREKAADQRAIATAIQQWALPIARIHWMKKIPRDPRHHSKIDYEALRSKWVL